MLTSSCPAPRPAQFLCYKQLKKALKQLPDTSAGARGVPSTRARCLRAWHIFSAQPAARPCQPSGGHANRAHAAPVR